MRKGVKGMLFLLYPNPTSLESWSLTFLKGVEREREMYMLELQSNRTSYNLFSIILWKGFDLVGWLLWQRRCTTLD